jgi:hypothetical protein
MFKSWIEQDDALCKGFSCVEDFSSVCNLLENCNSDKNQGTCINGVCNCNAGWTGASCSNPISNLNSKSSEKQSNLTLHDNFFYLLETSNFCDTKTPDEICTVNLKLLYDKDEFLSSLGLYIYASDPFLSKVQPLYSISTVFLRESTFSFQLVNNLNYYIQIANPSLIDGVSFTLSVSSASSSKFVILIPIFIFFILVIGFVLYILRPKKNPYERVVLNEELN